MNTIFKTQPIPLLLFIVLLASFYLPFTHRVDAEDLASPVITISSPQNNSLLNSDSVWISGTVSDDVTPPESIIVDILNSDNIVLKERLPVSSTGEWAYEVSNLKNGDYTYFIKSTDEAGKTTTETVTFSVNLSRPFVLPNVFPAMDQTHVALNTSIRVTLSDDQLIKIVVSDPIFVYSKDGSVLGSSTFDSTNQTVTFIPVTDLLPNTKYFVSINPAIMDEAKNKIHPRHWSFTTVGIPELEDPHGNYTHNVNTCVNCHGTHVSNGSKLEDGKYSKPNTDNYCMACHDGTVAPMPENTNKAHLHNFNVDPDLTSKSGTCTGCHNPHLTWSESNPNMFKDHWTYDHPNSTNETHDSAETLCEKCHDRATTLKKDAAGVQYNVYQYKKSTTATGIRDDFALCIRCHDGTKAKTNISQFYEGGVISGHSIAAMDGSPLNGQIPCADCHDTHGSNNIKILKEKLGHENQTDFSDATGDWDAAKERNFCTKCHNGSTAVYGVTARFTDTVQGHEVSSQDACSKCHGGASESFLEAAHAPKQAIKPAEAPLAPAAGATIEAAPDSGSTTGTTTTTESPAGTVTVP